MLFFVILFQTRSKKLQSDQWSKQQKSEQPTTSFLGTIPDQKLSSCGWVFEEEFEESEIPIKYHEILLSCLVIHDISFDNHFYKGNSYADLSHSHYFDWRIHLRKSMQEWIPSKNSIMKESLELCNMQQFGTFVLRFLPQDQIKIKDMPPCVQSWNNSKWDYNN